MKLFEGKSTAEKNKIIAALALGSMAVLAIGYNIIGLYRPARKTSVTVTATPTPTASPRTGSDNVAALPNDAEVNFEYTTTPVIYNPGAFYAPDAGRNIFAFYEPPPPTPYVPPIPVVKTPTPIPPAPPTPVPPLLVGYVTPQNVYAGQTSFRLEVGGDKFTPESVILFNGSQLPTTFISPQQLVAEIPANLIAAEGPKQIMVVSPSDPKIYSNQILLNVQPQPRPELQYIGAKLTQRANNDTAYFREKGKSVEFGARLNDTVGGRFRIISISKENVVLEDTSLGFRHRLALYRPEPGQNTSGNIPPPNSPTDGFRSRGIINNQPVYVPPQGEIPGIPGNVQRYNVPQPPPPKNEDDDDD